MNDTNKLLPVGSIVVLNNAQKKIMITGFYTIANNNKKKMFDYSGCLYPEGIISSDKNILFNHNQIEKVFYVGYIDDEEVKFKQNLSIALQNFQSQN